MTEHRITFYVNTAEATALLTVLRRIGPNEIAQLHEGIEWLTFDKACGNLRIALRDVVEPNWREELLRDLGSEKPTNR